MKAAAEVSKIHDVKEMLKMAAKMEEDSARDYNKMANECAANSDSISKQLFESLVGEEEVHFDQYDNELTNMNKFGDNYLALQSIERIKGGNAPVA
jgi:bacterioferritin